MTKSCHKYITHRKDKYVLPSEIPKKIQLKESQRRDKKCPRSKMMTITVTRHVGPEFKVYLPDHVSDCLLFLFFVATHDPHWDLLFSWQNIEPAFGHHEPPLVRRESAEGGDLQDHQHPPRAPEDQVQGKVSHKTIVTYTARHHPSQQVLAGVCAVRGRGHDVRGGDQGRLLRPPRHLLHWPGAEIVRC